MNEKVINAKVLDILLIEDNADDILLTELALKNCDIEANLNVARTGLQAVNLINEYSKNNNKKLPDLILLDINLPVINGLEVLNQIRLVQRLQSVPIVIFTSTDSELDSKFFYNNKSSMFIKKPNNIKELIQTLKDVTREFFDLCPKSFS